MKINDQQMKIILDDLYSIEPELRSYATELKKIIFEIVELRPEVNFDKNYRLQLRQQLMARASQLQIKKENKNMLKNIFASRFSWAMAGAVAVAVIFLAGGYLVRENGLSFLNLPFQQKFEKISLGNNAFGPLASQQPGDSGALGRGSSGGGGSEAFGLGGGGVAAPNAGAADAKMIAPIYGYKYVYKGEPIELKDNTVEVLRRTGIDVAASSLGRLLNTFGMGMINMGSFGSLKVQNVNLTSQDSFGYMISSNPQEGTIYINENYQTWPQPFADCRDSACYEQKRLKIGDVLPEEEILRLAGEFVKAHGINLSSYGPGEVLSEWRHTYEKTEDKNQFYIPDMETVVYPLLINGENVYDEGGNKTGISVSVNVREKRASSAGNITNQKYESSNYAAETDISKVLKIAERGGYWSYYPDNTNFMEIEIGAPKIGRVLMARYADGKTSFLLVPSMIFPVIGQVNPNYWAPKNVVVPLAKDLIEERKDYWIMGEGRGGAAVDLPAATEPSTMEIKN